MSGHYSFLKISLFNNAGHDTTASGISWCLYHLAKHPEYQHKARDEVDRVLNGRDTSTVLWSATNLRFIVLAENHFKIKYHLCYFVQNYEKQIVGHYLFYVTSTEG